MGAYTINKKVLEQIVPYKPSVEFHNSDIVKNWWYSLLEYDFCRY